jgi:hypothetical protein
MAEIDLEDAAMTLAEEYSISLNDAREIIYNEQEESD